MSAQNNQVKPDLSKTKDSSLWILKNRNLNVLDATSVHLNNKKGNGLLWMKDFIFSNGVIECDIRGKNEQGRSFVGIVFHLENEINYDAIYFRPFNFEKPQRKNHSVQYISHPKYTWNFLRQNFPKKYENVLNTYVKPNDWFHVKLKINHPDVEVFVNDAKIATLKVEQISSVKKGKIGFWVGNNSEGWFKNLKIIKQD
jgi:hypothetical protein